MGSKRNADMSSTVDEVKVVAAPEVAAEVNAPAGTTSETATVQEAIDQVANTEASVNDGAETEAKPAAKAKAKVSKGRSKKYHLLRSQVDKTKVYDAFAAVELVKRLSYTSFNGTIEAHGVLKETGATASFSFPHSTGKTVRVALASDELIQTVEAGTIDFDILLTTKEFMPKLTKLARVLGPKGLMPNPKNGTLTENPEAKKKELEGGKLTIKTEKKAPLIHTTVGKVSMETKELVENLQALMQAFKGKLVKLSISSTMSPGVKVVVE